MESPGWVGGLWPWHALRHTLASRLVTAGVDLRSGQELVGWRTPSSSNLEEVRHSVSP
jgi:site-specific recombinase XerC